MTGLKKQIPNALTVSRLVLSLVFFLMLALVSFERHDAPTLYLNLATLVYLIAAGTDWLDGYLARKWQATSVFGRVVDPFVDKVLVLGAFIYFAGPAFATIRENGWISLSGVTPTVVVILLAREFLVTTLRSVAEGAGHNYAAAWSGKLKMVLQCVTIFVILVYVNYRPELIRVDWDTAACVFRDICVWVTVAVTILSAFTYVQRTIQMNQPAQR
jgi:CDP-diacylglycerol---glycerol-3-phosphate 3-phosphatidyltransferase